MLRDLEILNIDYTASNSNYRVTETHKVSELDGYFLIPYEGPIYARNLVVRADGGVLTIEKDYTYEDDFAELEEMTGKRVIGSLRFSARVINDYKEIKLTYQKVANVLISRKYLLDSIDEIINNDKPVDWITQIFGKPDTYPPAHHLHDVSDKVEMVGFSDAMLLFKQATGQIRKHGLELWNKLKTLETKSFNDLNNHYTTLWNKIFTHIMNVSNPHGINKAHLELGNHPNYATATKDEDKLAATKKYDDVDANGKPLLRDDVISTPYGVKHAIEDFELSVDGYIRQGSLPFSYYGSGFYLSPPVAGTFEGLGTDTGGSAFCIESNGTTVFITRGYDSKVKKLYYYFNKNIYDKNEEFVFSGQTYDSPEMAKNGHVPNHVISGSSGRILVIGDTDKNQYYIGLGNGTLDAESHLLKKIDMTSFFDKGLNKNIFNRNKAYVMLIGDYVYLIVQEDRWYPGMPEEEKFGSAAFRTRCFYRIKTSELTSTSTKDIVFVRQTIKFQDSERQWRTQEYVDVARNVTYRDEDDKLQLKRCVYELPTSPTTSNVGGPWPTQWFNQEHPTKNNVAAVKFVAGLRWTYKEGNVIRAGDWWFCLPYEFDANTNTLTLDERFFTATRDVKNPNTIIVPEGKVAADWYHGSMGSLLTSHSDQTSTWVPRLGYVSARANNTLLPYSVLNAFVGYNKGEKDALDMSDYEMFNQTMANFSTNGYKTPNVPLDSPFGFTSKPNTQRDVWFYNGKQQPLPIEVFRGINREGGVRLWYHKVKESAEYKPNELFNYPYINKTIIGRPSSVTYGAAMVGGRSANNSCKVPSVFINTRDKYSVQYGISTVSSKEFEVSKTLKVPIYRICGSIYYDELTPEIPVSDGGYYQQLLATHTLDAVDPLLTITPEPKDAIFISNDNWKSIVKFLLGDSASIVMADDGGSKDGEYVLTMFFGAKPGTGNVYPSMAKIIWHEFSDPTKTYGAICHFNWEATGTKPNGAKTIKLLNLKFFSDEKYNSTSKTLISSNVSISATGKWDGVTINYGSEMNVAQVQMDFKDSNNYHVWFNCGLTLVVPLNACNDAYTIKVVDGVTESVVANWAGRYTAGSITGHRQLVDGYGLCTAVSPSVSGGAALYIQGGDIPSDTYVMIQTVFAEGNWSVFINTDMVVLFNGTQKKLAKRTYDLTELGVDYKDKVFYLYAISGKVEGYYDLTLNERTASPYHLLIGTITTNQFGIIDINIEQRFAISGFNISTKNKGGTVPTTSGLFSSVGKFVAVTEDDLFDTTKY